VDFTHDEGLSFLHGVLPGIQHLVMSDRYVSAGNHVLQTLAMYVCAKMFGPSELSLRLFSLASLAIWLGTSIVLVLRLSPNGLRRMAYFLLLQANPFLFDLFSAARGYGPAYSLLFAGMVLYMFSAPPGERSLLTTLSIAWLASLAVLSNLMALYFFAAVVLALNAEHFFEGIARRREPALRNHLAAILAVNTAALFPVAVLAPLILKLRMRQSFYFGGENGFVQDTMTTVAATYDIPAGGWTWAAIAVACLAFVCAACLWLRSAARRQRQTPENRCFVILSFVIVQIVAAFWLIGNRYPIQRTALFLIPLFVPLVLFLLEKVSSALGRHARIFSLALLLASCIPVGRIVWLSVCTPWFHSFPSESTVRKMMLSMASDVRRSSIHGAVSVGSDWFLEPSINYYRATMGLDWLAPADRLGYLGCHKYFYEQRGWLDPEGTRVPRDDHEYIYIHKSKWVSDVYSNRYVVLEDYPSSGYMLAKRIDLVVPIPEP